MVTKAMLIGQQELAVDTDTAIVVYIHRTTR